MFSKEALKKQSSNVTEDELEDMANLAYHIEQSEDYENFMKLADILDMYCLDHMTIMKIRDVIVEAVENARSSDGSAESKQ